MAAAPVFQGFARLRYESLGLRDATWQVQVYGSNLSDTRAQLYANYRQSYKAVTVSRPRTVGLRVSFRF